MTEFLTTDPLHYDTIRGILNAFETTGSVSPERQNNKKQVKNEIKQKKAFDIMF